jgi:alpha-N-arabinofuranosidase
VNKDLEEEISLTMGLRQFADYDIIQHIVLHDEDLYAVNTEQEPDRIVPSESKDSKVCDGVLSAVLPHKSWNMLRLKKR